MANAGFATEEVGPAATPRSYGGHHVVPYRAWVVFATTLMYAIWRANVEQLS